MSDRYFSDLLTARTVAGRNATPQDWQDALRSLADAMSCAVQHGDERAQAMAQALFSVVFRAKDGKPVLPY
jgi:hypothetical protein